MLIIGAVVTLFRRRNPGSKLQKLRKVWDASAIMYRSARYFC